MLYNNFSEKMLGLQDAIVKNSVYLKNAKQVVDKYHWIRQVIWTFERVRKDTQKQFQKDFRIYFKHSKSLLAKRYDFLEEHQKQQVMVMMMWEEKQ